MADINTMLAEVKRLDAEATPGEWRTEPDPGYECDECGERDEQYAIVRALSGAGICVVLVGDRETADAALITYFRTAAPLLAAEVERLRAELDQTDRTNAEIGADRERLRAEVERLTRDRDRLTSYVRAARQLSRDALTHIVEDRPEEAARTIFRAICALASAAKEGVEQ